MSLRMHTNVASLTAQRHFSLKTRSLDRVREQLSSGSRINRAGDDAAGLQLSEQLRTQIRGSRKAFDNVQDAINFLNVADGALASMTEHFHRVRELLIQAENDTYNSAQRNVIKAEITQIFHEIDRIAESTQFNGIHMLDEDFGAAYLPPFGFRIQVGPNNELPFTPVANFIQSININQDNQLGDMDTSNVGIQTWNGDAAVYFFPFDTPLERDVLWSYIDGDPAGAPPLPGVLNVINGHRAGIGAMINRLENVADNLQIGIENMMASESRIRNVDVASETATIAKEQILQQSASAMLTQANQATEVVLEILKKARIER